MKRKPTKLERLQEMCGQASNAALDAAIAIQSVAGTADAYAKANKANYLAARAWGFSRTLPDPERTRLDK